MRAIVTIFTKSHIAQVRTLSLSLKKHNPTLKIFALLADKAEKNLISSVEPFELISLESLKDQEIIRKMAFYYSPLEFCCALRPFLHEYIYTETQIQQWIYLDSDILVLQSFDGIFQTFEKNSLCLTLHLNYPVKADQLSDRGFYYEAGNLRYGLYNGGFLGCARSGETEKFIQWFKKKLIHGAFNAIEKGSYLDQLWLNYVPVYFEGVKILKQDGVNTAYWNLHERKLEITDGEIYANNAPLIFFHFSGWNSESPDKISRLAPWYDFYNNEAWLKLARLYAEEIRGNDFGAGIPCAYAFGRFNDGKEIGDDMRSAYYKLLNRGDWAFGDPFGNSLFFYNRFRRSFTRIRRFLERLKAGFKDALKKF